jgi:hypothetical protein
MSISFGTGLTVIDHRWQSFKTVTSAKNVTVQYVENQDTYSVFGFDGPIVYTCDVYKNPVADFAPDYTLADAQVDLAEFLSIRSALNLPVDKRSSDGKLKVAIEKPTNSKYTFITHNFCDPTTWYSTSQRVVNASIVDSGDHKNYTLPHQNIIDTCHGKIVREQLLQDSLGGNYRLEVFVDGVKKTEQDPHYASGGDYTVNYTTGIITFINALQISNVVTATYWRMIDSSFIIEGPDDDRNIIVNSIKSLFSEDIQMTDSFEYQVMVLADLARPDLVSANIVPAGTYLPGAPAIIYNTIADFLIDANEFLPKYPAISSVTWRGIPCAIYAISWDYLAGDEIPCVQYKAKLVVRMTHNTPFTGSYAACSFYCTLGESFVTPSVTPGS